MYIYIELGEAAQDSSQNLQQNGTGAHLGFLLYIRRFIICTNGNYSFG